MVYKSNRKDSRGQRIVIGDVLSSDSTHDIVVQWSDEKNDFIAVIIDSPHVWFTLDEFVDAWRNSVTVTNNINLHVKVKRENYVN